MKVKEAYDFYIHILNKYHSPSVEDFEFTNLFNTAQVLVLKDQTYHQRKGVAGISQTYGWEMSQQMNERWYPLIMVEETDMQEGVINFSDIIEDGRSLYHVDSVLIGEDEISAKWTRHNNRGRLFINDFTRPTSQTPRYFGFKDKIQVHPKSNEKAVVTYMHLPKNIVLDFDDEENNIDPELTDIVVFDVIFRTLQLQGINIREQQFYEMTNMEEQKQ